MHLLLQLICIPISYGVYKLLQVIYAEFKSPIRSIPGPKASSWLYGNFREIIKADNSVMHEKWISEYGRTLTYKGFLCRSRLMTADTKAINHILNNAYDYPKPDITRFGLGRIVGQGILVVEGNQHKHQRKIMNPAFANSHIRELTEIFLEKSAQLRDIWNAQIIEHDGILRTDVLGWLGKLTLDIIGLAGFNYRFNALNVTNETNELNAAFNKIFSSTLDNPLSNPLRFAKNFIPMLRVIPTKGDDDVDNARATMDRIGRELLTDAKSFLHASGEKGGSWRARDLFSLLVRANTDVDLPESQRMSDTDVLAQVPTFLAAGHETTSTATTWALYALTKNPEAQKKLRAELLVVQTDTPTADELNSLTYLDSVVRETLRIHPPVPSTIRVAAKDDAIPLKEPYTDKYGVTQDTLRIIKGDAIFVPLLVLNRDTALWGEDAAEFKPERWEALPEAVTSIPSVWGNVLSFLSGPRACIGYRFAVVEMKAILFTLVRAFEFELAVPHEEIGSMASIVQRPVLKNNLEAGNQMPLIIKPVNQYVS
ncbi:cytochrome P450 [Hymenopellis radicata]|nr:cytochrome P450 [Hymenopellis radicata]